MAPFKGGVTMFCPQCRKPASPENRFCIYCGARLEEQLSADEWYNRGYFFYTGTEGYPQDYDKAYACFLKAADMNELESINYIGVMYLDGIGKPQNTQTAIYWFRRALTVEPTFGRANFNLGRIYYDGIGVEMNYDLAYDYLCKAIHVGKMEPYYADACHFVAYIWMEVRQQSEKSVPYVIEALRHNPEHAPAWNNLGVLCEEGYYKPAEDKTPLDFYLRAAKLDMPQAMVAVGKIYLQRTLETESIPQALKDTHNAIYWLRKAVDAGETGAEHSLEMAELALHELEQDLEYGGIK